MAKIVVANWKMNPNSLSAADKIAAGYVKNAAVDVVVCPPTVFLEELAAKYKMLTWGAQDCFWEESGPFTGQISPLALKSTGANYVIIGHSEQREFNKSTDKEIGKKVIAVIKSGLTPILCVGGGIDAKSRTAHTKAVLKKHITGAFKEISKSMAHGSKILVVYEPPWALSNVSGNKPAPMKFVESSIAYIKSLVKAYKLSASPAGRAPTSYKFLYGGSVIGNNISSFVDQSYLDGFLVGGASLRPKEFSRIIASISKT